MTARLRWPAIIEQAAVTVRSYETGVTLRQCFYRLVAAELLPNTTSAYKALSAHTAEARRRGEFPELVDRVRSIHRYQTFGGPASASEWLRAIYRRDRTEGQDVSIYVAVEKAGIVNQLEAWFGDFGVPILALGGYSSQSYVDEVAQDVSDSGRDAVLLYVGDFDPSGEDIDRDFVKRTDCWAKVVRVALTAEQVVEHDLPPAMGKVTDSRSGAFLARHGRLVQVELDALPPDVLRGLLEDAFAEFWDTSTFEEVLVQEQAERAVLGMEP